MFRYFTPNLVLLAGATLFANQPAAPLDKDLLVLQQHAWQLATKSKDGKLITEATLRFKKDQVRLETVSVIIGGGTRSFATSSGQYEFTLAEKDKERFLLLKRSGKDGVLEARVMYRVDGEKLILKGSTPEGVDLSGEWTVVKNKK